MTSSTVSMEVPVAAVAAVRPASADRLVIPMARLGRYTLLEPVGEGGMAEVFRARLDGPMGFQKTLAIKRIRDQVVRADEEHVRAWATHHGDRIDLGSRGFLYLLVLLARLRLDDAHSGVPESECGWVHVDDLVRMAGMSENSINVSIHRLRRLFADVGVQDAARVVERRAYRRLIRIGVRDPTVLRG